MLLIVDKERREIVEDWFETREEAEARLAELVQAEPEAEGILVLMGTLGPPDKPDREDAVGRARSRRVVARSGSRAASAASL